MRIHSAAPPARLAATGLLLAATLMTSVTTRAAQPFIEDFDFSSNGDVLASCGSFDILSDGVGTVRLTTYFDRNGQPDRVVLHGVASGTLTNSVTGAFLVDSPSVANITVDLVAETETRVGTFFNVTVPGIGHVYFDTGRLEYDGNGLPIFVAGQQHAPAETVAILCTALQ